MNMKTNILLIIAQGTDDYELAKNRATMWCCVGYCEVGETGLSNR